MPIPPFNGHDVLGSPPRGNSIDSLGFSHFPPFQHSPRTGGDDHPPNRPPLQRSPSVLIQWLHGRRATAPRCVCGPRGHQRHTRLHRLATPPWPLPRHRARSGRPAAQPDPRACLDARGLSLLAGDFRPSTTTGCADKRLTLDRSRPADRLSATITRCVCSCRDLARTVTVRVVVRC